MIVTKTRVGPCSQLLIWTDHLFQWNSSAEWLRVFNQISYWSWVSTSTVEKPIEERGSLRRASWDAWEGTLDHTGRCPGQSPDFFLGCHQLTGGQAPTTYPALPIPLVFGGWNTESRPIPQGRFGSELWVSRFNSLCLSRKGLRHKFSIPQLLSWWSNTN